MSARFFRQWARLLIATLFILIGCDKDMANQPKFEPLEMNPFYPDLRSARQPILGTVARGELQEDSWLFKGRTNAGAFVEKFPFPISKNTLEYGQERFNIYCSPCHGLTGYGDGMIVQRGFTPPPSFHTVRLRKSPVGYIFHVIGNGMGAMPAYDNQIPAEDRWAIIAYIRALQKSQHVRLKELTKTEIKKLRQDDD